MDDSAPTPVAAIPTAMERGGAVHHAFKGSNRRKFGKRRGAGMVAPTAAPDAVKQCIVGFGIGVMSSEEVIQQAVFEVTTSVTTDPSTGLPMRGGLDDPRGGAQDDIMCATCVNSARGFVGTPNCNGHPGFIRLPFPVIHPSYIITVQKLLRCSCVACGACLLSVRYRTPEFRQFLATQQPEKRLTKLAEKCSTRQPCRSCGLPTQPSWRLKQPERLCIVGTWEKPKWEEMEAEEAARWRDALTSPSSEGCDTGFMQRILVRALRGTGPDSLRALAGLSPRLCASSLIMDALAVVPKTARPSRAIGQKRMDHDLTTRYKYVVSAVRNYRRLLRLHEQWEKKEITEVEVRAAMRDTNTLATVDEMLTTLIAFTHKDIITQITMLVDCRNTAHLTTTRRHRGGSNNRPSSLADFLGAKMGAVRRRMPIGPVVQTARAPISPAPPDQPVDVAGVPRCIVTAVSIPERVTTWNRERLRAAVRRGPNVLNGAEFVLNEQAEEAELQVLSLRERTAVAEHLQPGWTVFRHVVDGDFVLLNRAPTLHCMNIVAFRVRVIPLRVVQIALGVCNLMNADFDGDVAMLHFCQTLEARAEAMECMNVARYVIDPSHSMPVMKPQINTPLAVFLMTDPIAVVGESAMNMLLESVSTFFPVAELLQRLAPAVVTDTRGGERVVGEGAGISRSPVAPTHQRHWRVADVLCTILPDTFQYGPRRQHEDGTEANNGVVVIRGGRLLCGQWRGDACFGGTHSITQRLERMYGVQEACRFMSSCQAMGNCYLRRVRGFSLGAADMLQRDAEFVDSQELRKRLTVALRCVNSMRGTNAERQVLRTTISGAALTTAVALTVHKHAHVDNPSGRDPMFTLMYSDAKGDPIKIAQMRMSIGHQAGALQASGADGEQGDLLPTFELGAEWRKQLSRDVPPHQQLQRADLLPPEATGMVFSAYGSVHSGAFVDPATGLSLGGGHCGMNPAEMMNHLATGVRALAGTSCGVPLTGSLQARLAGGSESVTCSGMLARLVFTDRVKGADRRTWSQGKGLPLQVVRMHRVVSFTAGGNALDPQRIMQVSLEQILKPPLAQVRAAFLSDSRHPEEGGFAAALADKLLTLRRRLHTETRVHELLRRGGSVQTHFFLPLSARDIFLGMDMASARHRGGVEGADGADDESWRAAVGRAYEILFHQLVDPLLRVLQVGGARTAPDPVLHPLFTPQMVPQCLDLLWHLRPWRLARFLLAAAPGRRAAVEGGLQDRLRYLWERIQDSIVMDGSCTGLQAAYPFGRKMTQSELDRKHFVAGEESGLTSLERMKELVSADRGSGREMTKEPRMFIPMTRRVTLAQAEQWVTNMTHVTLSSLFMPSARGGFETMRCPMDLPRLTPEERRMWAVTWALRGIEPPPERDVLLIRLDRTACEARHITMHQVVREVEQCVLRAAGISDFNARAREPRMGEPDSERPLLCRTTDSDPMWSIMVTMRDWGRCVEALQQTALFAAPPAAEAEESPEGPEEGEEAPVARPVAGAALDTLGGENVGMVVSALALFILNSGRSVRGLHCIRGGSATKEPTCAWDAAADEVVATAPPRVVVRFRGMLTPESVANMHHLGLADFYQTSWNGLHVLYDTLGLEAARHKWVLMMADLLHDDVARQHLETMADHMFCNGFPESLVIQPRVFRGDGFMQAASFSHTLKVLREAALTHAREASNTKCALYTAGVPPIGSAASTVVVAKTFCRKLQRGIRDLWEREMSGHFSTMIDVEDHEMEALEVPAMEEAAAAGGDGVVEGGYVLEDVPMMPWDAVGAVVEEDGDVDMAAEEDEGGAHGAPPPAASELAGTLLPAGAATGDFASTAIVAVRHPEPSGLLLPNTDPTAFEFTGTFPTNDSVVIQSDDARNPEVVRRLQRHGAAVDGQDGNEAGGGPSAAETEAQRLRRQNADDVDDLQLFNNSTRHVPTPMLNSLKHSIMRTSTGEVVTEGSMHRVRLRLNEDHTVAVPKHGSAPLPCAAQADVDKHWVEMHGGQTVRVEEPRPANLRSGLASSTRLQRQRMNDLDRAMLPPEQRIVFDTAVEEMNRRRNAQRARQRREVQRARRAQQGTTVAWETRSPRMTADGARAHLNVDSPPSTALAST